jgi:hypothetical protein
MHCMSSNNDFSEAKVHMFVLYSFLQSGGGACPMCSLQVKSEDLTLVPQENLTQLI